MAATVFLAPDVPEPGATYVLGGDEGRHAAAVRRMRVGERLVLSDGAGRMAACAVTATTKQDVTVVCERAWDVPRPRPWVTVVQAIPKSDRAELAVELATEAGADAIVPWQAARCIARWDGKADKAVARWRAVARSAAKQARRAWVPEVYGLHSTAGLLALLTSMHAKVVVLHEGSNLSLRDGDFAVASDVVIVVGPEGGISPEELDALVAIGAQPALLGPTVLRTSTAAAVALGALGVLTHRWEGSPPS
ncbi:16S rRNA (uracil(1498)-N(3))-methyltransferase [Tsukamurella sp. 8F]|uniref:16S rRNA (uracil(1498)-N(3))-methyltransferase n=1 Tax=unclassified Tsukamurella TaxID=2633480 RepID=UPI0023B98046|nr:MULTISPECIES: 16S rRNA (uracil(1498)-N(3))-methyltransferase [unclassified Tsukamurella]MDF0530019.1 16S rRNA (uracil(1498)-N(3))-methyltransferase [Tsukamurella sp. 8J]MDF0587209.1 16S rRNA (uracil(1498)-N(3))-methyltransferase [Tsukamurella sp. 8F]